MEWEKEKEKKGTKASWLVFEGSVGRSEEGTRFFFFGGGRRRKDEKRIKVQ